MTDAPTNAAANTPDPSLTVVAVAPSAPSPIQVAGQTLLDHIKQAGVAELEAAKPLLGVLFRQFIATYEAKLTGVYGMIARPIINSFVDAIFGPAPTV